MRKLKLKWRLGTKINLIVLSIILLFSVIVGSVVIKEVSSGIKDFAIEKAKGDLKLANRYISSKYDGEWEIKAGKLHKGSAVMNDNFEVVDQIGDDTLDTVTIFQGNIRITTNVTNNGIRAIGTKVSQEVEEVVLKKKKNYYGEATVAGKVYQTAYMPLLDRSGEAIGMLYVGAPQDIIDKTTSSFLKVFLIVILGVIILASLAVLLFTRRLKNRLRLISNAMDSAGKGDFTTRVLDKTGDELTDLANSFNSMKDNLRNMIHRVLETSQMVAASSEELTAGAEQTSKATEQIIEAIRQVANGADNQMVRVEDSSNVLEEVAQGVSNMAENSSAIAESSTYTVEKAKQGGSYVENTVNQMNAIHYSVIETSEVIRLLDERSKQIDQITRVITDVADQTNLLALNAAIEAARAGEHGKGFAVVADEVRKLAEQSQQSSAQISGFIKEIQQEMNRSAGAMDKVKLDVQDGLAAVEETQTSFNEIVNSMASMEEQINGMAATSEQISASVQEVSASVTEMNTITREASSHSQTVAASAEEQLASMEEISASANELSIIATNLQELVSEFKI